MMKTFDELIEFLSSIPNIKFGGCGIAALVMYRWLKEQGEHSDIVYFYRDSSLYYFDTNEKVIKNNPIRSSPTSCSHAVISYKGLYYDSHGLKDVSYFRYHHNVPENIVVWSINSVADWNDSFDRVKYVKKIQKKTKIDLSDINVVNIW